MLVDRNLRVDSTDVLDITQGNILVMVKEATPAVDMAAEIPAEIHMAVPHEEVLEVPTDPKSGFIWLFTKQRPSFQRDDPKKGLNFFLFF